MHDVYLYRIYIRRNMYAISCDSVNHKEYLYDTRNTSIPCYLVLLVIFGTQGLYPTPYNSFGVCVCVCVCTEWANVVRRR